MKRLLTRPALDMAEHFYRCLIIFVCCSGNSKIHMKTIHRIFLFLATAGVAFAGPKEDLDHNRGVQRTATALFRQQKPMEAVAYISANVRVVDSAKLGAMSTAEALISVAFALKNSRQGAAAVSAANQALAIIASLPQGPGRDPARAQVLYSAGVVCERVLLDGIRGEQFHQAAQSLDPANRLVRERLQLIAKKKTTGRP